jgi:hypothetical protein
LSLGSFHLLAMNREDMQMLAAQAFDSPTKKAFKNKFLKAF